MKYLLLAGLSCLALSHAQPAFAQGYPGAAPGLNNRPPVSPYLLLNRSGGSVASNYYNLVRPQFEFRNNIQVLNQAVAANQQALTTVGQQDPYATFPTTGHGVQFMNYGKYFMNSGTGSAGARTSGATSLQRPGAGNRSSAPTR